MQVDLHGHQLSFTACRKCIIQYRNERQELAACQRLQEGKESKQVSQGAGTSLHLSKSISLTPPVAATAGVQAPCTNHQGH